MGQYACHESITPADNPAKESFILVPALPKIQQAKKSSSTEKNLTSDPLKNSNNGTRPSTTRGGIEFQ